MTLHRRELLAGCLGTIVAGTAQGSEARSYFPAGALLRIRANPSEIVSVYAEERSQFIRDLGSGFENEAEEHIQAGFCSVMAYDLTPYGQGGGSAALPLEGLVNRLSTDCDNYVATTWRFLDILSPRRESRVAAVGFEGGPFGNHAQMLIYMKNVGSWLVDPTLGIVQCGHDFDWIISGRPCDTQRFKSFYHPWRNPEISSFYQAVVDGLANGKYRPSHLLYYVTDLERFLDPPPRSDWFTPQAVP